MSCASTCPTQDCPSYGACLRSKRLSVTGLESTSPSFTRERERDWNSELDLYEQARKEGIQPATTQRKDIEAAMQISDTFQKPFQADTPLSVVSGDGS